MSTFIEYIQESAANTALQKKAEASGVSLHEFGSYYTRGKSETYDDA